MSTNIKILQDLDNNTFYPKTHTQAIIDNNSTTLEDRLEGIEGNILPSGGKNGLILEKDSTLSTGAKWANRTQISVGTTTTGEPGTDANVTNSGTAANPVLNFTIPKGTNGHNPCLGRFTSEPNPMPDGQIGDYLYIDITTVDLTTQEETTTTTVYHYGSNGWDGGIVIDAEHPTFASSQAVTAVHIKDLNDEDDTAAQGVLSSEAGKNLLKINKEYDFAPYNESNFTYGTWSSNPDYITFTASEGNGNGILNSVTVPNKPTSTRPRILLRNIKNAYYALKCNISFNIVSQAQVTGITFAIGTACTLTPFANYVIKDIYGNNARVPNIQGDTVSLDIIFEASEGQNYLFFSMDGFGVNDSITITDFSLQELVSIKDISNIKQEQSMLTESVNELNRKQELENLSKTTRWAKTFTKEDAMYKGRLLGNGTESVNGIKYVYIFYVTDKVKLHIPILSSDYKILTAVYTTFDNAKSNSGGQGTTNYFGNGISQGNSNTYIKFGESNRKSGYLGVSIYKSDSSVLTDGDITFIENNLNLQFLTDIGNQIIKIDSRVNDALKTPLNKSDFILFYCNSNGIISETTNNRTRLKFIRENIIGGNKKLSINNISNAIQICPNLKYSAGIFSDLNGAMSNASGKRLQSLFSVWQTEDTTDTLITSSGILSIYFVKDDNNTEFTIAEIEAIRNAISITVDYVKEENTIAIAQDKDELPIEVFVRKGGTGSTLTDSTTILSSPSIVCVPYLGIKYNISVPSDFQVRFVYGDRMYLGTPSQWVTTGDIIIPQENMFQRLQISKVDGSEITIQDIENIKDDIHITYDRIDGTVEERNRQNEQYVKAAMLRLYLTSEEAKNSAGLHTMATIIHVSDLHGDMKRFENAVQYAKFLGINYVVSTGDSVLYQSSNGVSYLKDVISKYPSVNFLNVIGNHEAIPTGLTNTEIFNNYISEFVASGGYKKTQNTDADNAYYYVDDTVNNLRIVVLNQYDSGCYYGQGLGGRLGQLQVTWFCNTLLSTPQDYGVIVAMHANEDKIITPSAMSSWNQTINYDGRNEDEYGYCVNGLYVNNIRPIKTIIDAFIGRTSLITTYTENTNNGNNGETVSINVDFSNVASGVEFVCYLTGHRHKDNVGYLINTEHPQLILNIVNSNCYYPRNDNNLSFAEGTDLPRGDKGITQDAFNVYAIDRINKRVKIARVGSGVNFEGIERRFIIASYTTIPSNS